MKTNVTWLICGAFSLLFLAGCGSSSYVPRGVKVGNPYDVDGTTYTPAIDIHYDKIGMASWYGPGFHGKRTATGEQYDQHGLTAAHPTLPMPSMVRVTNLANGRSVVVRINDRGPFKSKRIIDLSQGAAESIGIKGLAQVRVQYLPQETAEYIASLGIPVPPEMQYAGNVPSLPASLEQNDAQEDQAAMPQERMDEAVHVAPLEAITEKDISTPVASAPASYQRISNAGQEYVLRPDSKNSLRYFIQAGAFSLEENAKRVASRLADIGNPDIQQIQTPEKIIYRVRVGPLASSEDAENALEKVRSNGLPDAKIVLN